MAFSEHPPEKAAVHAAYSAFYRKSGDVSRAEDEMLFAYFLDPDIYADSLSEGTSETPTTDTRDSVRLWGLGLGLGTWLMYRMLF